MTPAILWTIAFLPVYLLLRQPFRRLPLHIDTGFYVSNHTVATGRLSFSKGWNAHFAGCSKVIPEVFYSCIYLLHSHRGACGDGYQRMSRLYASLFNYLSAIAVGMLTYALSEGDLSFYYAGLIAFALLSSEPHYGVYFECGELFELLPQVLAVLCLMTGLEQSEAAWIAAGAFLWAGSACFIKLSAGIGFMVLFGGLAISQPWTAVPTLCGGAVAAVLYAAWIAWNLQSPLRMFSSLFGHEASFNRWGNWKGILHRLIEKARLVSHAFRQQPWIPALAVGGVILVPPHDPVFWLFTAAVTAGFVGQATDCRYYMIPLLPTVAVCAAFGGLAMASTGFIGLTACAAVVVAWILRNTIRAARLNVKELNAWCWQGAKPASQAARNLSIQEAVKVIHPVTQRQPMLVYGSLNQAYVLLQCSYETPLVAPEHYLDDVCPGWQRAHNRRLVADPPEWVLDTSNSFDAAAARAHLGLDYRMALVHGDDLRLYHLSQVTAPSHDYEATLTFRPQAQSQLEAEEQLAGNALVREAARTGTHFPADADGRALSTLIEDLARKGHRRLAVYGAGRFTIRHAEIYRQSMVPVSVVLDDNAALRGPTFLDWPVRSPDETTANDFDAIIISTDRFTGPMLANVRRRWGDGVAAYTLPS